MTNLTNFVEKTSKKKLIIIISVVLLLIILSIGGYLYWNNSKKSKKVEAGYKALEKAESGAEKITESATKGTLPSVGTNPLENKPDINPADKANPYKNIKTNPFK